MEKKDAMSKDYEILSLKFIFAVVFLTSIGLVLALLDIFYLPLIVIIFIIGTAGAFYWSWKNKYLPGFSKEFLFISLFGLAVIFLVSFSSSPTIFSGRDQGAISEAAIRLAQNHSFQFKTKASKTFFQIYGQGKALNFPGFHYTKDGGLITQFPLIYIVWLAIFYSIFGLLGITIANAILLYFFILIFYFLLRRYFDKKWSLIGLSFILTSFSFSWFSKYTLSENMALPILWFAILSTINFLKQQRKIFYYSTIFSAMLLIMTRIEGAAFFFIICVILYSNEKTRRFLKENLKSLVISLFIFALIFAAYIFKDINFYKEIIKATVFNYLPVQNKPKEISTYPSFYTTEIFFIYGLLGFFVVGFLGTIKAFIKRNFSILIALLIIAPTLIFFFDSHISPDHPWMLRRYIFSLLPAAIFYSLYFISFEKNKNKLKISLSSLLVVVLVFLNMPAFLKYFTFSENKSLLKQTEELSQNFTNNDLVLIDRNSSGDNWAMISGPLSFLYNKNAVYFFNPNDYFKIDKSNYDNIYLIVDDNAIDFYQGSDIWQNMTFVKNYQIISERLDVAKNKSQLKTTLPEKINSTVNGKIFKLN